MLQKEKGIFKKLILRPNPHHGWFFPGEVHRNEDREANINFGLTVSIWRVEREEDKKVVPCWVEIRWSFWTWRQKITIVW